MYCGAFTFSNLLSLKVTFLVTLGKWPNQLNMKYFNCMAGMTSSWPEVSTVPEWEQTTATQFKYPPTPLQLVFGNANDPLLY